MMVPGAPPQGDVLRTRTDAASLLCHLYNRAAAYLAIEHVKACCNDIDPVVRHDPLPRLRPHYHACLRLPVEALKLFLDMLLDALRGRRVDERRLACVLSTEAEGRDYGLAAAHCLQLGQGQCTDAKLPDYYVRFMEQARDLCWRHT